MVMPVAATAASIALPQPPEQGTEPLDPAGSGARCSSSGRWASTPRHRPASASQHSGCSHGGRTSGAEGSRWASTMPRPPRPPTLPGEGALAVLAVWAPSGLARPPTPPECGGVAVCAGRSFVGRLLVRLVQIAGVLGQGDPPFLLALTVRVQRTALPLVRRDPSRTNRPTLASPFDVGTTASISLTNVRPRVATSLPIVQLAAAGSPLSRTLAPASKMAPD